MLEKSVSIYLTCLILKKLELCSAGFSFEAGGWMF